ncbi:MAG: hypothetical protein EPO26_18570 [Chloroflexota bacterium]|nr:MAG: hypothetical protein EPO26_18570 [Chloroflexota bacterium]
MRRACLWDRSGPPVVLTSNVPFDAWGRVFGGDEVIASAILDRLLHHSHVFHITGPSYRMKDKLATIRAPPQPAGPEPV